MYIILLTAIYIQAVLVLVLIVALLRQGETNSNHYEKQNPMILFVRYIYMYYIVLVPHYALQLYVALNI